MEKYWISFFRDGTIVRPQYGDVEIPHSPWWFYFFEMPWKWVIVALLGLAAFYVWSGGGAAPEDARAHAETEASAETTRPSPLSLACDRGSYVVNLDELGQLRRDAEMVNTAAWVNIAIGELGQREYAGDEANPRVLAYMATAQPKFTSDERPWNSQFVNYVLNRAGKTGTNSGLARSWLSWGKDAIAEVGDPVVGAVVVASRDNIPGGGAAGFYMGTAPDGSVRMLAGNICAEVSIVSVPEDKILGYRLPADWLGPAQ